MKKGFKAKKLAFFATIGAFGLALAGCSADSEIWNTPQIPLEAREMALAEANFIPGTFTGRSAGYFGYSSVNVVINEDGAISDITLNYTGDNPSFANPAFERIRRDVLDSQSASVDVFTNATLSSNTFISAINQALIQATPEPQFGLAAGTFVGIGTGGYRDDIHVQLTIDADGSIVDVEVVFHDETPAFADAAFATLIPQVLTTQSANIDIHVGATPTSNAFIAAVADAIAQAAAAAGGLDSGVFVGIGTGGYRDDIHVQITIADGVIVDVEVVFHDETPAFADAAFATLIPQVLDVQSANIDIHVGATPTSNAFIAAVADAIAQAQGGAVAVTPPVVTPPTPIDDEDDEDDEDVYDEEDEDEDEQEEPIVGGDVIVVTLPSWMDAPMTVQTTLLDGDIVSVVVLSHDDTPMFFDMVMPGLAETIVAANSYNVDSVSGATVTADAIIEAVRRAVHGEIGLDYEITPGPEVDEDEDEDEDDAATVEPAAEQRVVSITLPSWEDAPMTVQTTLSGNDIVSVVVTSHGDTPMFFDMVMPDLANRIVAANSYNVDGVSGATVTANAIIDAVRHAVHGTTPAPVAVATPEPAAEVPVERVVSITLPSWEDAPMTVQTTLLGNDIISVVVTSHDDTPMFFDMVMPDLANRIVAANSYNVDGVSGATVTADAIIEAVRRAVHEN